MLLPYEMMYLKETVCIAISDYCHLKYKCEWKLGIESEVMIMLRKNSKELNEFFTEDQLDCMNILIQHKSWIKTTAKPDMDSLPPNIGKESRFDIAITTIKIRD